MLLAVRISSYGCTWEVWRALKKLELLEAQPRATLTLLSCSPNFPRASITRYTHAKHKYNQRVMDVEMGAFALLVFGTNGGMGLDCQNFLRTLANKFSTKNDEPYASVVSWLRIELSFAILRTVHRCVRGSRYQFKSREVSEGFTLAVAGLHLYS